MLTPIPKVKGYVAVLKDSVTLSQLEDNDTDVFQESLVCRHIICSICVYIAEVAATFVTNYKPKDEGDVLPPPESETMSSQITLTGGFGMMSQYKREAVIRFHRYNKDAEPTNWYTMQN